MDKKEKYELIVKIKGLLIDTRVHNDDDINDADLISLNASKVMSLIYSNPTLTDFFNEQIKTHQNLRADKRYKEFLKKRDCIFKFYKKYNDELEIFPTRYILTDDENDKYLDLISFFIGYDYRKMRKDLNWKWGIFDYECRIIELYLIKNRIYFIFDCCLLNLFKNRAIDAKNDDIYELFNYRKSDEYKYIRNVIDTYDFYYLKNCEFENTSNENKSFFMHLAYRKVLSYLLEHLYTLNMTPEQKQEHEKRKEKQDTLKEGLMNLMYRKPECYKLLDALLNKTTDRSKLPYVLDKGASGIDKQIYTVSECLMGKRYGIKILTPFIAKNEAIIRKLIDNLSNKKNL